jgi:CTP synthase
MKWIVVSGGVISGLGKGVVSASLGRLLSGSRAIPIKCDGYLNVDPGTMNPFEHGEVFVLEDGGEVDMDFGHYERFMGIQAKASWNLTSGKILSAIIERERKGDYLGKTVQIIPHVTDEIKRRWRAIADREKADVCIIEIGGTVGDIENQTYYEAVRQLRLEGDQVVVVHLTYVPYLESVGEQKTKPTQQSVSLMLQKGLQPDIIICRSKLELDEKARAKVALFCNVPLSAVISNPDIACVYELPLIFKAQGVDSIIKAKLGLDSHTNLDQWAKLVDNILNPQSEVEIAVCGKYTALHDAYISINEALVHAGAHLGLRPKVRFIETTDPKEIIGQLEGASGLIVPGGFGGRGAEGKLQAIKHARESKLPFLGLCYGMQLAVVEFSRNVCKLEGANSTEIEESTKHPVICLLEAQRTVANKGATMRLGAQEVAVRPRTRASELFCKPVITKRFRHRYEVNPEYVKPLEAAGLIFSATTPDNKIMQLIELPGHPFFMGSQFHPELTSKLETPDPMFIEFLKASLATQQARR